MQPISSHMQSPPGTSSNGDYILTGIVGCAFEVYEVESTGYMRITYLVMGAMLLSMKIDVDCLLAERAYSHVELDGK